MKRQMWMTMAAGAWLVAAGVAGAAAPQTMSGFALIPAGTFEMGDHHGFVDPKHGSDELPLHSVSLGAYYIGIYDVTTQQYCEFLNSALAQRTIEVRKGGVCLTGGSDLLCDTRETSTCSRIGWDGRTFSVLDRKENHPMVCVRWHGAVAYCNWLSAQRRLPLCYNTGTWDCDFNKSGFRLPTEPEWEYAARGGQQKPYYNYPWGNDADPTKANVPESKNPFRSGPMPWTTPVGFFNGKLQHKSDFGWPGAPESYQTANGVNGFGLYDTAGNVWQWCTEWYERNYYAYSPTENPPGPATGSPMPDSKPYRCMRGGSWSNGEFGHSRVSNRDPSYFRGPDPVTHRTDPDGPYFHIGFRVVLPVNAESRPVIKPTPVQRVAGRDGGQGGGQGGGRRARQENRQGEGQRPGDRGGEDRPQRTDAPQTARSGSFVLSSPEVTDGGTLPKEFTGDGESATLPLAWTGAPAGTKSYALIMHHEAPDMTKWYWILYNIPADTRSLPKNVKGVGTLGNNSVNERAEYTPPRSKGPGAKTYIYTVYALSAPPQITVAPDRVNREVLLAAMKDKILASAALSVVYTRQGDAGREQQGNRPPRDSVRQGGDDQRQRPSRDGERGNGDGVRDDRPQRSDNQQGDRADGDRTTRSDQRDRGGERQGGGDHRGGGGDSGGRHDMPENKIPTSPNPGQTVGLYVNTPKACSGYTLFAPKHNTATYLMDNQGRVVHQWKSEYEPGQTVYLLPNGHLLRSCMVKVQGGTAGGEGGRIEEYDWDGKMVWEFNHATRDYQLHHDIKPMPNGHILALMVERKSREQALAVGFDSNMMRDEFLVPDAVVEIEPTYPKGGKIVWEWHVWDHLIQHSDKSKPNFGDPSAHPELVDVACNGRATPAFWNHMNSLDYNPTLDQIVLSVRGCNEIWIIDHGTTTQQAAGHIGGRQGKGGDLLYRWGNPAAYQRGTTRDKQLVQQHDAQWIPAGSPGAGHMTIFNNGYDRGWSSIEEIVLPVDANGRYALTPGKTYGPEKPVWHYEAKNRTDFFSAEISGAHRLPNGNTLICAGIVGNLFEVTATGETVWQYVNAMVRGGILAQGEVPGKDMRGHLWNAVFKVHRYPPEYVGLRGRDLAPKGVVELPASMKGKTGLDNMTEEQRHDRGPGGGGDRNGQRGRKQGGQRGGDDRGDRPPRDN